MLERARHFNVPCAALVGAREHAVRQVAAGVDIIVAQGTEAGGHCGEVSTMVLIPEVLRAVEGKVPVLAAGGIMTGRQMAGCMAMGAAGVWTGSVWLATTESETSPVFREKMITARSRDTVRSRGRTGKPARQLRSAWTDAWEGADSPGTLPMPLQGLISEPAMARVNSRGRGRQCEGPRTGHLLCRPGRRAGGQHPKLPPGRRRFYERVRRGPGRHAAPIRRRLKWPKNLTDTERANLGTTVPGWAPALDRDAIRRDFKFADFNEAWGS